MFCKWYRLYKVFYLDIWILLGLINFNDKIGCDRMIFIQIDIKNNLYGYLNEVNITDFV